MEIDDENIKTDEDNKIKIRMTKEEYKKVKQEYFEDKKKKKPRKSFNSFFGFKKRRIMNKSMKRPDMILVFLINLKKQIEAPILTKIYGGNFLVIRNHVYRFNPERVFSFGKYKTVIAREFDRELIGIDDYNKLFEQDALSKNPGTRMNINDPVLIKALIQAKLAEKQGVKGGALKWIIIALVVVGLVVGFFLLTNKTPTPIAAPTVIPPLAT